MGASQSPAPVPLKPGTRLEIRSARSLALGTRQWVSSNAITSIFYETRFRDAPFEAWQWARLNNIKLPAEKPLEGKKLRISDIGNEDDDSMFGFVARHWPNFEEQGDATRWLVCDDGSMESADFIYFDNSGARPSLTLIHGTTASGRPIGMHSSGYQQLTLVQALVGQRVMTAFLHDMPTILLGMGEVRRTLRSAPIPSKLSPDAGQVDVIFSGVCARSSRPKPSMLCRPPKRSVTRFVTPRSPDYWQACRPPIHIDFIAKYLSTTSVSYRRVTPGKRTGSRAATFLPRADFGGEGLVWLKGDWGVDANPVLA